MTAASGQCSTYVGTGPGRVVSAASSRCQCGPLLALTVRRSLQEGTLMFSTSRILAAGCMQEKRSAARHGWQQPLGSERAPAKSRRVDVRIAGTSAADNQLSTSAGSSLPAAQQEKQERDSWRITATHTSARWLVVCQDNWCQDGRLTDNVGSWNNLGQAPLLHDIGWEQPASLCAHMQHACTSGESNKPARP
ncbi:unnamed protein product [Polarella glacialis]|uniref:Uncharacterized protein n=1 Tax=Polarella glacialis TaxID=89957 RepID=A0A813FKG5_POLGL|nr:unnamed protein product [Polarella glacialis]